MATEVRVDAQPQTELRPISEVAAGLDLDADEVELFGRDKAKIGLSVLERLATRPNGKLIAVTAITPTKAGEGKTTTAISLTEGLGYIGESSLVCLREPSVGPTLGAKGGGTGAGLAQVVPGEDINLHFTGDLHAIAAANNLLASAIDAHLVHGNELGIDPATITWRRCLDIEDRVLRRIAVGLGEDAPFPRECGFDITAASEVMALLAMARDRDDLRHRLGAITVATTREGSPVTAEDLEVAGAMAVLLKDAIKPNLVQTLEGQPALVHAGPFANIAHGNSSLVGRPRRPQARRLRRHRGRLRAATSASRSSSTSSAGQAGLSPDAVVLVATTQALKRHGGDPDGGLPALERGAQNLAAHLRIVEELGFHAVVAVNKFPGDTPPRARGRLSPRARARRLRRCGQRRLRARGRRGCRARGARRRSSEPRSPGEIRSTTSPIRWRRSSTRLARKIYGGTGAELSPSARETLERLPAELHEVPVCVAKTHLSLSHDPELVGAPTDFVLPVRELRAYTGAGWLVAVCGETQTMPGLPAHSAAERMDLDAGGRIVGLA